MVKGSLLVVLAGGTDKRVTRAWMPDERLTNLILPIFRAFIPVIGVSLVQLTARGGHGRVPANGVA